MIRTIPFQKVSSPTPPPLSNLRSTIGSGDAVGGGGSPAFGQQSSQDLLSDEEEEEREGAEGDEYGNGRSAGLSKEEQDRLR